MTIVGAGVVGMCAASYLQRAGCRVTVLDPVAPGQSTSFGNAGGLSPDSFVPVAAPGIFKQIPKWLLQENGPLIVRWSYLPKALPWLWRFVKEASPSRFEQNADAMKALMAPVFECYAQLLKDARAEHLIHRVGQLYVYSSDKAFAGDRPILEMRQRKGAKIEILSAGEIRETEPALAHIFRRGVLLPNHGHCANPAGLVAALAETFVRNGGQILRQRVLSMDIGAERVDGIVTEGGVRPVDVLLLAAGVWSGRLAAMLGHNVPIESHRGYHVTLADPSMRPRRNVGWVEHKFLATPMDAGLRFAGTVEIAGLDAAPNYRRADALLARGRTMFAGLQHGIASRWMGHRPCLPDSVPVIGGSAQLRNVFFAFGHGHVGLICAPATGRLIAEMITGATPGIDPSPYRINRFR